MEDYQFEDNFADYVDKFKNLEEGFMVGKIVESVDINQKRNVLRFKIKDKDSVLLYIKAECCSESWIEHVSNIPDFTEVNVVTKVVELTFGKGMPTKQDVDTIYGLAIFFKGPHGSNESLDIEFRNSSNGYYGARVVDKIGDYDEDDYDSEFVTLTEF